MGVGHRLTEFYAVWDTDPTRAVKLVLARAKVLDEKVTALDHVSDGVLACLMCRRGDVVLSKPSRRPRDNNELAKRTVDNR
jgi:Na+/H+-dicarboxylate symporter